MRRAASILLATIAVSAAATSTGCSAAVPAGDRAAAWGLVSPLRGADDDAPPSAGPAGAGGVADLVRPQLRAGGQVRLDEALALALVHNPGLRAARRRIGVAEAEVVTAAQLPYNPELELSAAGDYAGTGRDREASLSVGLRQTFETGGQRGLRTEAASRGLDAARATVADAERRVREEVAVAFFDGLFAARELDIADAQLEVNRRLLDIAEARQRAGDIAEVEVGLVRLEARQAEAERVTAVEGVETARVALRALLGLPSAEPLALEGPFPVPRLSAEADLETEALARRPDLDALRREHGRAATVVDLERASRYPDLTVGLTYDFERGTLDDRDDFGLKDKDHLLGVGVAIPLPIWNRREGEILAARREVERVEAEVAALEVEVRREVRIARERLRAALARARLYDGEIAPLAEKNLDQTREAYRLGQIGTVEVLRAQDERIKVARAAAEALRDRAAAEAALEAASGGPK